MLRSHWMGAENQPGNQEENIMIEVYYAEDDETIGKSVKEYLEKSCRNPLTGIPAFILNLKT